MDNRQPRRTLLGFAATLFFCAFLLIPPTDARAITFEQWAVSQGWYDGYVAPDDVSANASSIDSLAGIDKYNWTASPTTWLWLPDNQISNIESNTFTGLGELRFLDMQRNQLTSIESGDFAGLNNLEFLNLDDNQITSVESNGFAGLNRLDFLQMSGNQIAGIESGDFAGLSNLTYLFLSGNQITSIDADGFTGLDNLTFLDLCDNQITSINAGDFTGLDNLTDLILYSSQIATIDANAFTGLGSLTELGLGDNQITTIESADFAGLNNLRYLSLWGNQITTIESAAFAGLGNLEGLFLGDNPSMTTLNLDRANFSSLVTFDVPNNTSITRVSLKDAVLTQTALDALVTGGVDTWGGEVSWNIGIGDLPDVTELDLSGVDFSAITDLSPLHLMDSLTDLWLVDVLNLDANALDTLLDNLATMEDPSIEGALYLTQADFDAFNDAGDGKLTIWDAEDGHHVEVIGFGDANGDGVVDDADASILASHWRQASGAGWFDGDFNGDGKVNDIDASILASHWHAGMEETGPSVPEPTMPALLVAAVVSLGLFRFRRPGFPA